MSVHFVQSHNSTRLKNKAVFYPTMKWYATTALAVAVYYAVYTYAGGAFAAFAVLGFLLSLFDHLAETHVVFSMFNTLFGILPFALASLFSVHARFILGGLLFSSFCLLYDKGIEPFKPFTNIKWHLPTKNVDLKAVIWSIVIIILVFIQ